MLLELATFIGKDTHSSLLSNRGKIFFEKKCFFFYLSYYLINVAWQTKTASLLLPIVRINDVTQNHICRGVRFHPVLSWHFSFLPVNCTKTNICLSNRISSKCHVLAYENESLEIEVKKIPSCLKKGLFCCIGMGCFCSINMGLPSGFVWLWSDEKGQEMREDWGLMFTIPKEAPPESNQL